MEKHPSPANTEDPKPDISKTVEYRRFHKLLKQVIKVPPLRKKANG